ncbi:helix-turn-helix domain-containing protein [Rothia mucilaginosa]|uniref:helix-turn-helix domain-containing protein n=1 Tax=Rothia mucilaginosa TaxID=43675 RepID=UPI0028EF8824|nr:helix-turn-helix domain-containing protein [Rothia mucilaginosa]
MAKKTSTEAADTTLRAYKFRLDPIQTQKIALAQCAGAARYAYNLLTTHNLDVSRARADYWHTRIDAGAEETTGGATTPNAAPPVTNQL